MKNLIRISLALLLVSSAAAQTPPSPPRQKTLRIFDWQEVKLQPPPPASRVFSTNGISVLEIENPGNARLTVSLLTITDPSLIAKADALSCEMKYQDVGYAVDTKTNFYGTLRGNSQTNTPAYISHPVVSAELTVIRHFPPEAAGGDEITDATRYFLSDTSNWKPYGFMTGNGQRKELPIKLEVKLFLPTNGTVYLRPVELLAAVRSPAGWWSPQQSGLIGGIGGSVIGCLGGLIGLLVSKGRARDFVLAAVKYFIALGVLLTIAGLVAVVLQQPYAVWYALLLPGVVLVLVFSLNLHSIQRRYDELEIRRMTSLDATGS